MPRSPPHGPNVRVVADTNTVVSAFLWGGPPAAVLEAARQQRITLLTSAALLDELAEVLGREKFASRIRQVGSTVAAMRSNYRALATLVEPLPVTPTSRDPDDDAVLACALAATADLIVTRDNDLLTLGTFRHIRIVNSADALAALTQSGG
jgi:putative PIN family toxin of toxin-antitoxin system